ncbi:LysE family translocator [Streptomyces sp. 6N223]|uniref:LysE family translocator n=1 Tax=Streptomyces sp. 6N223 TaxID=3457412 RepID=UPI003FCF3E81
MLTFLPVAGLLVITPGPDMALITKNALTRGRQGALATALGIESGLLVWTAASVLGITAVIRASETAFTVLRYAGAAYLVYLGVSALLALRAAGERAGKEKEKDKEGEGEGEPPAPRGLPAAGSPFRQGLLSNIFNPKIVLFFTSLIPQFVSPDGSYVAQTALLAGIFMVMGLLWLVTYAWFTSAASAFLRRPRVNKVIGAATGCVLIGFGAALAIEP